MTTYSSRVRWLLVAWLTLMGPMSYTDRVNISIAGQAIAKEYHLSTPNLGF